MADCLTFCEEQINKTDEEWQLLFTELRSLGIRVTVERNDSSSGSKNLNDNEELQVLVDFIKHALYQKYEEAYSDETLQEQQQQ